MKREELWTPSARRFECLLKAAQNGDYNAYMSLMARFFKVMDDKARNNYLRDYEMFTALVERVSEGIAYIGAGATLVRSFSDTFTV